MNIKNIVLFVFMLNGLFLSSLVMASEHRNKSTLSQRDKDEIFFVKFGIIIGAVANTISIPEVYQHDSYKRATVRVISRAARGGVMGYVGALFINTIGESFSGRRE